MDYNSNKPIYLQLADQLMDQIECMTCPTAGLRLPSVRDYAAEVGVNANTAVRTYNWLQQEGIIYQQRGLGYYYADDARERVLEMRRRVFYERELGYFLDRMATLGITPAELDRLYRERISEK